MNRTIKSLSFAGLVVILAGAAVIPIGCRAQPAPSPAGIDLSSTMVPNLDMDVYAYFKQDSPTKIPRSLVGSPSDVSVASLAIWGLTANDQLTTGGALTLTSAADATSINSRIPAQAGVWTSVSDRTIYFVQGSGPAADSLRTAISKNDFKRYQEQDSLGQVARLPSAGSTKLAAIAVVKPSKSVLKIAGTVTGQKTADMISSLAGVGQLQTVVVGLYAPGQIDLNDLAERAGRGTLWEANLGMVALVRSGLPGAVVGPIATKFLENAGYTAATLGGLTVYKGTLDAGRGGVIPFYLNVNGNSLTLVASGKDQYAQTLITGVKQ